MLSYIPGVDSKSPRHLGREDLIYIGRFGLLSILIPLTTAFLIVLIPAISMSVLMPLCTLSLFLIDRRYGKEINYLIIGLIAATTLLGMPIFAI